MANGCKAHPHSMKMPDTFYQYTMAEEVSRERFIYPYCEQSNYSTLDFVKRAIAYFGCKPETIQTNKSGRCHKVTHRNLERRLFVSIRKKDERTKASRRNMVYPNGAENSAKNARQARKPKKNTILWKKCSSSTKRTKSSERKICSKKSSGILCKRNRLKAYRFMDQYQKYFGLRWLLRWLKICPNAYYNYRKYQKANYDTQKSGLYSRQATQGIWE